MLLPRGLPSAIGSPGSTTLTSRDIAFDVAIAGIPFCSAVSADNPYIRESAQVQKQQFDAGDKAGEHSLEDWWRRSQSSFHGGMGLLYAEPDGPKSDATDVRYWMSKNLDVWTPGQVTRLPDTTQAVTIGSAITGMVTADAGATHYVLIAFGTTLRSWDGTSTTDYNWLGTGTILSLATDGESYYVADNAGIYQGPVDGGSAATKIWDHSASRVKLAWVKERLMAALDNALYELDSGAGPALPGTANYAHPNTGWTWTDFADGPTSILVAGYSGIHSAIHELELDASSGAAPTLVAGKSRPMPTGEIITSLTSYVGSFVGIGTNKGFRVGQYSVYGAFQYGPRLWDSAYSIKSLVGRDGFLYATATRGIDDESCLYRVDLGMPTDQAGRFAYASDLIAPTLQQGTVSWVAVRGDGRLVWAIDGYGVILEGSGPGSGREAWLVTSRIRMSTIEPKLFRRIQVRGSFSSPGTVAVRATGSNGETKLVIPEVSSDTDLDDLAAITAPLEWTSLQFDLNHSGDIVWRGYVLKALTAVKPRRLFQLPLRIADDEMDRFNVRFGHPGYGMARLLALEAAEDARDEVRLELFTEMGTLARQCTIEQVSYRQIHQPGQTGSVAGIAVVTLKTV